MITPEEKQLAEQTTQEIEDRDNSNARERLHLFGQRRTFVSDDARREAEEDAIELARAEGRY